MLPEISVTERVVAELDKINASPNKNLTLNLLGWFRYDGLDKIRDCDEAFEALCAFLKKDVKVLNLIFSYHQFNLEQINTLLNAIQINKTLERIVYSNLKLRIPHLVTIFNAFKDNTNIKHLDLTLKLFKYFGYTHAELMQVADSFTEMLINNYFMTSLVIHIPRKNSVIYINAFVKGYSKNYGIVALEIEGFDHNTAYNKLINYLKTSKQTVSFKISLKNFFFEGDINTSSALIEMLNINESILYFSFNVGEENSLSLSELKKFYLFRSTVENLLQRNYDILVSRCEDIFNWDSSKPSTAPCTSKYSLRIIKTIESQISYFMNYCDLSTEHKQDYLKILSTLNKFHWLNVCPLYGIANSSANTTLFEFPSDIGTQLINNFKFKIINHAKALNTKTEASLDKVDDSEGSAVSVGR